MRSLTHQNPLLVHPSSLLAYEALFPRVEAILGRNKAVLWFTTPNPLLGEFTPIGMINLGRAHRLEKFIAGAERANETV